jgi:hypothetical protein
MPDVIWRLFSVTWQGVPVASLAVFAIGGLMYAVMSVSTRPTTSSTMMATRRPGWIARRRARGGIRPTKPGAAIGYASATRQVGFSPRELALGGLILGAPGSGKTYAAAVLIEALAWQGSPCVILDPKPSRDLAAVVTGVGGTIWTLGGELAWDALPQEPSELANQLVEVHLSRDRPPLSIDNWMSARAWRRVAQGNSN